MSRNGKNPSATPGGGSLISLRGTIGAVKLGVSTEAGVTAAIGSAEATAEDNIQFPGAREYKALGYACTPDERKAIALTHYGPGPYCRAVYYINLARGVLGSFWTSSPAFHTERGTHVGTPTETAARREHRRPGNGCHVA